MLICSIGPDCRVGHETAKGWLSWENAFVHVQGMRRRPKMYMRYTASEFNPGMDYLTYVVALNCINRSIQNSHTLLFFSVSMPIHIPPLLSFIPVYTCSILNFSHLRLSYSQLQSCMLHTPSQLSSCMCAAPAQFQMCVYTLCSSPHLHDCMWGVVREHPRNSTGDSIPGLWLGK